MCINGFAQLSVLQLLVSWREAHSVSAWVGTAFPLLPPRSQCGGEHLRDQRYAAMKVRRLILKRLLSIACTGKGNIVLETVQNSSRRSQVQPDKTPPLCLTAPPPRFPIVDYNIPVQVHKARFQPLCMPNASLFGSRPTRIAGSRGEHNSARFAGNNQHTAVRLNFSFHAHMSLKLETAVAKLGSPPGIIPGKHARTRRAIVSLYSIRLQVSFVLILRTTAVCFVSRRYCLHLVLY